MMDVPDGYNGRTAMIVTMTIAMVGITIKEYYTGNAQ